MATVEVSLPDWPTVRSCHPLRRSGGGVRGADADRRRRHAEGAGARRVAEPLPPVAVSLGGRFRPGRSASAPRCARRWRAFSRGRPAARAVAARRDAHAVELHRPSVADAARGFVEVSEARSDWAPDPANPLPTFSPPRRVPHGVTLIGRLFDEGTVARAGLALERAFGVAAERPPGF